MRLTTRDRQFGQTTAQYKSKVDQTVRDAIEYEQRMRELERRENEMLQRLQNTQRINAAEQQKLRAMRSPQR